MPCYPTNKEEKLREKRVSWWPLPPKLHTPVGDGSIFPLLVTMSTPPFLLPVSFHWPTFSPLIHQLSSYLHWCVPGPVPDAGAWSLFSPSWPVAMDRDSWACLPPVPPSSLAPPMLWVKMLSKTKCDCTLPFRMKLTLWAWSKMLPGPTLPALRALLCISAARNQQYKAICETAHGWCIFSPLDLCLNLSSYRQCPFLPGGYWYLQSLSWTLSQLSSQAGMPCVHVSLQNPSGASPRSHISLLSHSKCWEARVLPCSMHSGSPIPGLVLESYWSTICACWMDFLLMHLGKNVKAWW